MNWQVEYDKYNRRKYKRFTTNLKTSYAITRLNEDKQGEGIIKNVSYGGLGIDVCDVLNKKAHLIVEIKTNGIKSNITIAGKVIWFKNYGDFASCGIKLEWISNENGYADYIRRLEAASGIY